MNWKTVLSLGELFKSDKKEDNENPREGAKGYESSYDVWIEDQRATPFGDLGYDDLRTIYLNSSSIRSCVDLIARIVSTLPYLVKPKPGGDILHAYAVKEFFKDPNNNEESIRDIFHKVLVDTLILDSGVIEKVKSLSRKLLEIVTRDGKTVTAQYDTHGRLLGYVQRTHGHKVEFSTDEICQFQFAPRTWNPYGTPIIPSIVDEITTLMFSIAEIGRAFTSDEIPPGLLVLEKIGEIAYKRLLTDLTSEVGIQKKRLRIARNVGKAGWVQFKRSFQEMQLAELSQKIESIVYRNFGIFIEGEEMQVSYPTLLAWTQMINYAVNRQIIPEFFDDVYFKLVPIVLSEKIAKAREAKSRAAKNYKASEIFDREELRRLMDEAEIPEEALD